MNAKSDSCDPPSTAVRHAFDQFTNCSAFAKPASAKILLIDFSPILSEIQQVKQRRPPKVAALFSLLPPRLLWANLPRARACSQVSSDQGADLAAGATWVSLAIRSLWEKSLSRSGGRESIISKTSRSRFLAT